MKVFSYVMLILVNMISFQGELSASTNSIKKIYLIPGQGADHRLFNKLEIEGPFEIVHIKYFTPVPKTSLKEYASQLMEQIDTCENFILIGVSLGGMLASEISLLSNPEKTIIISSAKSINELPKRYTFQRKFPLYKIVGPRLAKLGSKLLQPLVEPDRNKEKEIFKSMLAAKDPKFLRRTIEMIINWDRQEVVPNIIHIHGNNDKTVPLRNVKADHVIPDGSHMMTLTNAEAVSLIVNKILQDDLCLTL